MSEELPSNVIPLLPRRQAEEEKITPACQLQSALEAELSEVVVIGIGPDNKLFFSYSSDHRDAMWLLEIARKELLDDAFV